jgi:integrase
MRGNGRVYQRGTVYWIGYSLRGKPFRESARTEDRKAAERFLRHRMKEVGADLLGVRTFVTPQASRLTIHELLEALRSDFELRQIASPQNLCTIRKADAGFGTIRATDLTAEEVDAYIQRRQAEGAASASINRITQVVKQAYGLAIEREHLSRMPSIRHLSEKGNERQGFFTAEELAAVISHLPADLRDFTGWCAATGMRKSEATGLTWDMLNDDELRIPGNICKNRKARVLPLVGQLAEIIARRQTLRPVEVDGTVRMAKTIFHRAGEPINEFRKSWATACVAAGLGKMVCPKCHGEGSERTCKKCEVTTTYSGRIFHDLRRSAVRRMIRAKVDPQLAKKWSGHVTDSMLHRYSILTTDDMREAFETTEKFREPEKQKVVAMR